MIAPVCKFCRQQTINLDIQEMNQLSIIVYACHKCDAEYLYWSDSMSLSAIALYTKFKNKTYRWSQSIGGLNIITISNEKQAMGASFPKEVIKKFKANIEINPQNVSAKISTILTFL